METATIKQPVQPPKGSLVLRPKSYRSVIVICFLAILALVIIGMSFFLSPYILFVLLVIVPGIILPILYLKNGFMRVTPEAVELSGFSGKISKRITYSVVYQVALVDELVVSIRNGAIGCAIVFLDENGDQLFFAWSVHYSKEQLMALYDLFDTKDKVYYKEPLRLYELKSRFQASFTKL